MSVCLWTLTGLLQLHPVIAVTAFVLPEVQPSQYLWLLPLEIHRQGEVVVVNYGSSNYFITGFHKKRKAWTLERPRWSQTACLANKLSFFAFYTLLPRPLKSMDSQAQASWLQRMAGVATYLHSWAQSGSGRAGRRLSGTRVCMLAFCVHFRGFGFSCHLYDPKAQEELSIS